MDVELDIDIKPLLKSFSNLLVDSERPPIDLLKQQMKGVVARVINITPPGHIIGSGADASVVIGRDALTHGRALVRQDISSIYGTPSQAFDLIEDKDAKAAKAFWSHYRKGRIDEANTVMSNAVGSRMYSFDGGTTHRRFKGQRARGKAKRIVFFTNEPKQLEEYIRDIQGRVGWLAAGWNESAKELGLSVPEWIGKHNAPGAYRINVTSDYVEITATNAVKFASQIDDMKRRVQDAVDGQTAAIDRQFENYLMTLLARNGLALAA